MSQPLDLSKAPSREGKPTPTAESSPKVKATSVYGCIPYEALSENESRLLHLQPGEWEDPIIFEIRPFSLDLGSLPFYEAVSYAWEDPANTYAVTCSGSPIRVTRSVENLLRRFRWRDSTRLLWVDAVCINQSDTREKASQVRMMDIIYQRASRVLVYLGEADCENPIGDSISDEAMMCFAQLSATESTKQMEYVMFFIGNRPWFHRIWVLQEVALAEYALVVCGSHCIPWACITAWWLRNMSSQKWNSAPATLRIDSTGLKRKSLLEQLHQFRSARATDPRDKIYGLIGLLSPEYKASVAINYIQSVETVYAHVAISILEREKSLKILSAVTYHANKDGYPRKLPSWIPDWNDDHGATSLGLSNVFTEPYDAGGSVACGLRIDHDTLILSCLGIKFDIVSVLGEVCPRRAWAGDIVPPIKKWYNLLGSMGSFFKLHLKPYDTQYNSYTRLFLSDPVSFNGAAFQRADRPGFITDPLWPTMLAQPSSTLQPAVKKPPWPAINAGTKGLEHMKFCLERKLLVTDSGSIGLAPAEAEVGDIIAVLIGAPTPHILRKEGDHYKLIGECYVRGIMGGEAIGHLSEELKPMGHRCRPCPNSRSDAKLELFEIG